MSPALERKHCISRVALKKKVISYGVSCVYVRVCVYSYGLNICPCALCDKKGRPKLKTLSGIRNASSIAQTQLCCCVAPSTCLCGTLARDGTPAAVHFDVRY